MKTAATEIRSMTKGSEREAYHKAQFPATRAGQVDREEIRTAMQKHFSSFYNFLTTTSQTTSWLEDEWNRFHVERDFMAKIFGLGLDIDDDGKVSIVDIK